jgi:hypothetical protein
MPKLVLLVQFGLKGRDKAGLNFRWGIELEVKFNVVLGEKACGRVKLPSKIVKGCLKVAHDPWNGNSHEGTGLKAIEDLADLDRREFVPMCIEVPWTR